jgi:hypothetical protein
MCRAVRPSVADAAVCLKLSLIIIARVEFVLVEMHEYSPVPMISVSAVSQAVFATGSSQVLPK